MADIKRITTKNILYLFTDGSVNPQEKIGFATYLLIDNLDINSASNLNNLNTLKNTIKCKMFEDTSSTKLEVQTLLWALGQIDIKDAKLIIYTDCQNIIGLDNRREKLEKNNYYSKTGKQIKNHLLYKEYYSCIDKISYEFIKVKGHKKSYLKDNIDNIFTLVDKASRNALREYLG